MSRIEPFSVTTPAGTLASAYQVTSLPFQKGIVTQLDIVVPPGPSGLVGFKVAHSGQAVIPPFGVTWIITDDEKMSWPMGDYPVGAAWELWTYNTDVYEHTIYLRFHVAELGAQVQSPAILTTVYPIASAEDAEPQPPEGESQLGVIA